MSILVIGGTGFIGVRIVRDLIRKGREVVCFDAYPNLKAIEDFAGQVPLVRGDITSIEEIIAAIKDHSVSRIINLAYVMGAESDANPNQAVKVNVLGMDNVFEAARLTGIKHVVYPSSIAYHGPQSYFGDKVVNEADLGYLPVQTYSATKRLNEYMADKYSQNYGMKIVGLRVSIVYGHGRERGLTVWSSHFASNPAVGKKVVLPYRPEEQCNIVYVDDVAEMFCRLVLADDLQHLVYLSGGHTVTLAELSTLVKQLLPSAQIDFEPTGREMPLIYLIDGSRFEKEFGFQHTPLLEGIKRHINEARNAAGLEALGWDS